MELGLRDRVALVTGGSRGIGCATSRLFAAEGARVLLTYRSDKEAADGVASSLRASGCDALTAPFDLRAPDTFCDVVRIAMERWGRIDVLVNNAAHWQPMPSAWRGPFEQCPTETWQPLLRANVEGCYAAIQQVVGVMRRQQWGRIVNVSSAAAVDGMPEFGWYAAAKASMHGLTYTLAKELGPEGILVNVVMPGATMTESVLAHVSSRALERQAASLPIRRVPDPIEVASVILFLGSAANSAITGEVVRASGGRH